MRAYVMYVTFFTGMIVSLMLPMSHAWSQTDINVMAQEDAIRDLINHYAKSIETANVEDASTVWATDDNVSFIQPRGHQRGWEQIKTMFYQETMEANFSQRSLQVHEVSIHVLGDAAWAEFYWTFNATMKNGGQDIQTQGRETQVFKMTKEGWRIVHVHYSGMPVTADGQGF
jgi:ketosteroid isomerase-like protein